MAQYKLVTGPSSEPITLAEAKLYLRVDDSTEDALITSIITAARRKFENDTYHYLLPQTWELYLNQNEINAEPISLNKSDITAISNVKYYDQSNTQQTLSTNDYQTAIQGRPYSIQLTTVPQVYNRLEAMVIRFTLGYTNAAAVPEDIKIAIKTLIGTLYENRQTIVTGTQVNEVPDTYKFIMENYRNRVYGF
jgi:uncharacterized phiE125 gp8 family phage protein